MARPSPTINCPVAIHRWFVGGEGWAYHPRFAAPDGVQVRLEGLKPELQKRSMADPPQTALREWNAGMLLILHTPDTACQDPEAAERMPTILRVAYLPSRPTPDGQRDLSQRLLALNPARPGDDEQLRLSVDASSFATAKSRPRGQFFRSKLGWATMVGIGILCVGFWMFLAGGEQDADDPSGAVKRWAGAWVGREPGDGDLRPVAQPMQDLLRKWEVDPVPDAVTNRRETVARFFRFLSQEECGVKLSGVHPDVSFVRRLPERPPQLAHTPRVKDIDQVLVQLDRKLEASAPADQSMPATPPQRAKRAGTSARQTDALLKSIEATMDYQAWLSKAALSPPESAEAYPWMAPAPPGVRAYVNRFLPRDGKTTSVRRADLQTMLKQLRGWNVRGVIEDDLECRPWLIAYCYVDFLSRQRFPPDLLQEHTWETAFVRRLPEKPKLLITEAGDERRLIEDGLRPLVAGLEVEDSPLVSTLLTNIAAGLEFEAWKQTCTAKLTEKKAVFADGFAVNPRNRSGTLEEDVEPFGTVTFRAVRDEAGKVKVTCQAPSLDEPGRDSRLRAFVDGFREPPEKTE